MLKYLVVKNFDIFCIVEHLQEKMFHLQRIHSIHRKRVYVQSYANLFQFQNQLFVG